MVHTTTNDNETNFKFVEISKDKEYVDSPEDAPEGVQVYEGEEAGVYYYLTEEVPDDSENRYDEDAGYRDHNFDFGHGDFKYLVQGDTVEFQTEDGDVIEGEYVDHEADMHSSYLIIEGEDGQEYYANSGDVTEVKDPVEPGEGENIPWHQYRPGDEFVYSTSWGEDVTAVVTEVNQNGEIKARENTGREFTAGAGYRMKRTAESNEIGPERYVLTTSVENATLREAEEILDKVKDDVVAQCKDDEIAKDMIDNVSHIRKTSDNSSFNMEDKSMKINMDQGRTSIPHEYAHALGDAYGYSYENSVSPFSNFFVSDMPKYEFGEPVGKVFADSLKQLGEERDVEFGDEEDFEQVEEMIGEDELTREHFHLQTEEEEVPDEVERIADEVNNCFDRVADAMEEDDMEKAEEMTPLRPYCITNGHELLAGVQQIAQSETGEAYHVETLHEYHPELLEAYLDVFEPSDSCKTALNAIYESNDDSAIFDDIPYPDIDEDGEGEEE